jgi:hypothetical protein
VTIRIKGVKVFPKMRWINKSCSNFQKGRPIDMMAFLVIFKFEERFQFFLFFLLRNMFKKIIVYSWEDYEEDN